jgi:hypothetical protein
MNLGFGIGFALPFIRDALAFIGTGCLMMLVWDAATRRSGWQDRD